MTPTMREQLAQEYAARALYVSLHTADPGDTGAGELVAAGRLPLTWTAGSVDGQVVSGEVTFPIAVAQVLTHVGIWSDAVGGDFLDSYPLDIFVEIGEYAFNLTYTQN